MDIKLHYNEKGSGEPLVLLHGSGENSDFFSKQITYFSKRFQVIAVETRGHGRSPRGTAPFTLRQFAEDLRELLDELGLERVSILGCSEGGNTALVFALHHPERVNRLILDGAYLYPSGVRPHIQIPLIYFYEIASLLANISPIAQSQKERLGVMVNQPHLRPSQLGGLEMPVLVLAGTRDKVRQSHTKLIGDCLPDSRVLFLPGTRSVARQNAEVFNREVERFLKA